MPESLNGFIERVTYHNPENGFAVLRVKVKGREDLVTVVGSATSVTAGEPVEATRGKKLVVLVGTKKALAMAVRRAETGQRHTTPRKRLQEARLSV
jgi:exodeoxyribonuclease V alpha subunit